MTSKEIIRRIQAAGWAHARTTGSPWHFQHATRPGVVTVPHPKRDMAVGTLKSIERQSGVKLT